MAVIEFTIERDGYPTIKLDADGGGPYGLQAKSRGFGIGPIVQRTREGAAHGVQYDGDKVAAKSTDIGLLIMGTDRLSTGTLIRNLRNMLRWRADQPFPKLVATWPNGDIQDMPIVYESGLEQDYTNALPELLEVTVGVFCPDPFWTARTALQFAFDNSASATPFLDDLAALPVASSLIGGAGLVTNPGDIDADLAVVIHGPSTGYTTILINGVGFVFQANLSNTETINAVRTPRGVTWKDQTGANRYNDLGPAPKLPQLRPGDSSISVTMVGATTDSYVRGYWKPRYEGVY